jgi:PAS domain S-box-containing protein
MILIDPESKEMVQNNFKLHSRGQEVPPHEYSIIAKDGRRIDAIYATKLISYEGKPAILGIVTDITARKRVEIDLKRSEERLKVLFESAPDAYYINDIKGRYIDGNVAAENLVGYKREELIGQSFLSLGLFSKSDAQRALRHLSTNALGQVSGPDEFNIIRKDGSQVPVEIMTFPTTIDGKRVALGIARDVSQRKSMERKLRESEKRFRSMFESMIAGVALHELTFNESGTPKDYRIIDVNPAYEEHAGISREKAIGNLASEVYGTGYPPNMEVYKEVALSGKPTRFETLFSPMQRHFDISVFSPARGQFVTVFRDVSEEKKSAKELQRRLKEQMELREAGALIAESLDLEMVLPRIAEIMGRSVDATSAYIQSYDREKATATVLAEYYGPRVNEKERVSDLGATYNLMEDFPGTIEFLEAAIPDFTHFDDPEVGEAERRHMVEYGAKSSLTIPIKIGGVVNAFVEIWEGERKRAFTEEEITYCQTIARHAGIAIRNSQLYEQAKNEIAERKAAQEALQQSESRFRSIFEGVEDAIFVESLNGEILDVNDRACEMFGYDKEEFLAKTVDDLVPEGKLAVIPDEIADGGIPDNPIETVNIRANGEEFPVELSTRLQTIGDQSVMLAVVRDISDRKKADRVLEQYRAELERSNDDLKQFAYVASHDLQEPLRMVTGFMELLAMKYQSELDEDANEYIAFAIDGAERMQRLIKDLLVYSTVGSRGKLFESTNCDEILKIVLTNMQVAIKESSAQISHDQLPTVNADKRQLAQLFQNLVSNAIKFNKDDSPVIHIYSELQDDDWLFSVQDNGIGIAAGDTERIFGVSQRLHSIEEYPGTGLGLAISKKIVERHGGQIWVESQVGNGSTIFFTLPA